MKQVNITITTYECEEYLVDIVTTSDSYEAWLYRKEYGVKVLMFGAYRTLNTLEEFLETVEANIDEYAESYDNEYAK